MYLVLKDLSIKIHYVNGQPSKVTLMVDAPPWRDSFLEAESEGGIAEITIFRGDPPDNGGRVAS